MFPGAPSRHTHRCDHFSRAKILVSLKAAPSPCRREQPVLSRFEPFEVLQQGRMHGCVLAVSRCAASEVVDSDKCQQPSPPAAECFLQVKTPGPSQPVSCPFCKEVGYSVVFRGKKARISEWSAVARTL